MTVSRGNINRRVTNRRCCGSSPFPYYRCSSISIILVIGCIWIVFVVLATARLTITIDVERTSSLSSLSSSSLQERMDLPQHLGGSNGNDEILSLETKAGSILVPQQYSNMEEYKKDVCKRLPTLDRLLELASKSEEETKMQQEKYENGDYTTTTAGFANKYPLQFLADFAIIGFSKCGTSSMNHLFSSGSHPEIAMVGREDSRMFRQSSLREVLNNTLYTRYWKYWCNPKSSISVSNRRQNNNLFQQILQQQRHSNDDSIYGSDNTNDNRDIGDDTKSDTTSKATSTIGLSEAIDQLNNVKPPYFGYKSPNELYGDVNVTDTLRTHFPKT